jgi:precorrin-6B methylase 2
MKKLWDRIDAVRELGSSYWAFSALCVALEVGLLETLVIPRDIASAAQQSGLPAGLTRRILDVLVALGLVVRRGHRWGVAKAFRPLLRPAALTWWRAELRCVALHARKFLQDAEQGCLAQSSWSSAGAELMQMQGLVSAAATDFLITTALRRVDGLLACLSRPDAVFLDAGAGVCGATIVLARRFPELRTVALEPVLSAQRLARRNIREAGIAERVELRRCNAENLRLQSACDVAHVAQMFFSDASFDRALERVYDALRPGGYLLTTASNARGASLAEAVSRLRNETRGSSARLPGEIARRLVRAGYVKVTVLDGDTEVAPVIGRRARKDTATRRAHDRA